MQLPHHNFMKRVHLMKRILLLSLAVFGITNADADRRGLVVFDQVAAIVYQGDTPDLGSKEDLSENKLVVITQQDIERRGFDGNEHDLKGLETEVLLWQKAELLKMSLSDEDVDRQLDKMGMPKDQQIMIAEKWNYADVDEFKSALKKMYASNISLGFETESGLVIPEVEVQAYYDKDPIWLEAEYEIKTAFVPFKDQKTKKRLAKKLEKLVVTGSGYKVAWSDSIAIKKSEISVKNDFLTKLKAGMIYKKSTNNGFDLFKMVKVEPHRLQPLLERKVKIVSKLRDERYPIIVEQVKKNLKNKSSIYHPKQVDIYLV
jgi:hypothetical protein